MPLTHMILTFRKPCAEVSFDDVRRVVSLHSWRDQEIRLIPSGCMLQQSRGIIGVVSKAFQVFPRTLTLQPQGVCII